MTFPAQPAHPTHPAPRKSEKPAPSPAVASRSESRAPAHGPVRGPNYAGREETMKIAEQIMDEDREVFRRLADA